MFAVSELSPRGRRGCASTTGHGRRRLSRTQRCLRAGGAQQAELSGDVEQLSDGAVEAGAQEGTDSVTPCAAQPFEHVGELRAESAFEDVCRWAHPRIGFPAELVEALMAACGWFSVRFAQFLWARSSKVATPATVPDAATAAALSTSRRFAAPLS